MLLLTGRPAEHARAVLLDEVVRLESLAIDLRRYADGIPPAPTELAMAPVLHFWRLAHRDATCLIGICRDPPRLTRPLITTSTVAAVNEDARWARTRSHLYALGEPAGFPARCDAA